MKTPSILLLIIIIAAMVLMLINAQAQVYSSQNKVYSSWASAQIRHSVEVEKPEIEIDTIVDISGGKIITTFKYKQFQIKIGGGMLKEIAVESGGSLFILKPDDEYAILEKLIPLIR